MSVLRWIGQAISTYVLHPLHGNGYQWWSGAGSDLGEATIVSAILLHVKHTNCHRKGCWWAWPFTHAHPEHGFHVCRKHYNHPLETP